MSKPIIPDVSRHVHFVPVDHEDRGSMVQIGSQPLPAVVLYVHNERSVNLAITDHHGFFHTRIGVALVQPGDELPGGSYCRWMPYQVRAASESLAEPDTKGDGSLSGAVASLIATTEASLSASDVADIEAGSNSYGGSA